MKLPSMEKLRDAMRLSQAGHLPATEHLGNATAVLQRVLGGLATHDLPGNLHTAPAIDRFARAAEPPLGAVPHQGFLA